MNIALLCDQRLTTYQQRVLDTIFADASNRVRLGIIDHRKRPSAAGKLKRNLKRGRGGYVLVMAWNQYFGRRAPSVDTESYLRERGVAAIKARFPYRDETVNEMLKHEPDVLVLIGGFGIIRKRWLELCEHGVLSYHHGDMRAYRGQPPCFWELYNDAKQMGVTVQRLSAGLDSGEAIVEKTVEIRPDDRLECLHERAYEASVDMMAEALRRIDDPAFTPPHIEEFGPVYTLPNLRQWLNFKIKMMRRR